MHKLRKPFLTNFGNCCAPTSETVSHQLREPLRTSIVNPLAPNFGAILDQIRKYFRTNFGSSFETTNFEKRAGRRAGTRGRSGIRKVGSCEGLGAEGLSADRRHKLYPTGTRRDAVWRGVGNKFDTLGLPAPVRRNPGPTGVPLKTIEKVWGRFWG